MAIALLDPNHVQFPDPNTALEAPDGLLAAGGALTPQWLLAAYERGIFPWFDRDDDYILWWSPSRRAVCTPGTMTVRRSLKKRIRNAGFTATLDTQFRRVIQSCGVDRPDGSGTWITPAMQDAYNALHELGYAHSVEIHLNDTLVGGLYGIALGRFFFGESMFSRESDGSKVAFYVLHEQLKAWQFTLIDCQMSTPHLTSLGVQEVSRARFLTRLQALDHRQTRRGRWTIEPGLANLSSYEG